MFCPAPPRCQRSPVSCLVVRSFRAQPLVPQVTYTLPGWLGSGRFKSQPNTVINEMPVPFNTQPTADSVSPWLVLLCLWRLLFQVLKYSHTHTLVIKCLLASPLHSSVSEPPSVAIVWDHSHKATQTPSIPVDAKHNSAFLFCSF